jgi:Asp-tRNA(Asn)/Glu-tRNA(Gln) amidotransferase A subunit family amidase
MAQRWRAPSAFAVNYFCASWISSVITTFSHSVSPFPVGQRYPKHINRQELTSYIDWMYLTFVLTLTGCPVISVPVGLAREGMPVGLQIMGRPRSDSDVLRPPKSWSKPGNLPR